MAYQHRLPGAISYVPDHYYLYFSNNCLLSFKIFCSIDHIGLITDIGGLTHPSVELGKNISL